MSKNIRVLNDFNIAECSLLAELGEFVLLCMLFARVLPCRHFENGEETGEKVEPSLTLFSVSLHDDCQLKSGGGGKKATTKG